jgi:hypothetical protein
MEFQITCRLVYQVIGAASFLFNVALIALGGDAGIPATGARCSEGRGHYYFGQLQLASYRE